MKKLITIITTFILFTSFVTVGFLSKKHNKKITSYKHIVKRKISKPKNVIYIQTLGDFDANYIVEVRKTLEKFYDVETVLKPKVNLTDDILAGSKTRYDADKILDKFNSKENLLLLIEKDIAYNNGKYSEWGIFGLGLCPGNTCVISTFRLKNKVSESKIIERLVKVCVHEIGHNLGLKHCETNLNCMMSAANGTIKTIDKNKIWFCKNCINKIK
jgi:archaemetzincin